MKNAIETFYQNYLKDPDEPGYRHQTLGGMLIRQVNNKDFLAALHKLGKDKLGEKAVTTIFAEFQSFGGDPGYLLVKNPNNLQRSDLKSPATLTIYFDGHPVLLQVSDAEKAKPHVAISTGSITREFNVAEPMARYRLYPSEEITAMEHAARLIMKFYYHTCLDVHDYGWTA